MHSSPGAFLPHIFPKKSVFTRGLYHFRGLPFAPKSFVGSKSRCGPGNSSASLPQHPPALTWGSSWTRGGGGSVLLLFPFFCLLAELGSKKYQLLPLVAMALMMGRAVSWEVDWHNQFISHRSATSHQIIMIFVRYRPRLDWKQWPGDERHRKKSFYFVYGHTPLLSPPHSFSCPKLFLFLIFFLFSTPKIINPSSTLLIAMHHMGICWGFVKASVIY